MSEHTPITGELRKAMVTDRTFCGMGGNVVIRDFTITQAEFDRLCDAIDAIHANLERENAELRDQLDTSEKQKESYREDLLAANRQVHASYNDGFDEGFASADDWLGQHKDAMAEHGWVELPKDADGVPIRIGDMMESECVAKCQVEGVCVDAFFAWSDEDGCWHQYDARVFTHAKPDTWERIIKDARMCTGSRGDYTAVPSMRWTNKTDALVARCKALCERTKGGDAE